GVKEFVGHNPQLFAQHNNDFGLGLFDLTRIVAFGAPRVAFAPKGPASKVTGVGQHGAIGLIRHTFVRGAAVISSPVRDPAPPTLFDRHAIANPLVVLADHGHDSGVHLGHPSWSPLIGRTTARYFHRIVANG